MAYYFSQGRHLLELGSAQLGLSRLSTGRGPVCHRVQFCLMLYLLLFKKGKKEREHEKKEKKERKGRSSQGAFSLGGYVLVAVPWKDFPGC
jgi:hypothetical protein